MDLPELDYEGLLTSDNPNQKSLQKAIEKQFTSDSRDNSIVNILCTIGENKTNAEDSSNNKFAEKESMRTEKDFILSSAISPKLNANNNQWKNLSLVNNPGSNSNLNLNGNININNLGINLKTNDLITPKTFQNKFVLLESANDMNSNLNLKVIINNIKFTFELNLKFFDDLLNN